MKMNFGTVSIEKVFPLMGVFDDVAVSKKGALTIGWELSLPTPYSCEEKEYDDILANFSSAIRLLPANSIIHRQDMYVYERYDVHNDESASFLEKSYFRHFKGRTYPTHHAYIFVSIASGRNHNLIGSGFTSGLFGIGGMVEVPSAADFDAFRNKCQEFITVMCSGGRIAARKLREADWLGNEQSVGIVQRYMMLGNGSPVMSDIAISPDGVSVYNKSAFSYVIGESDVLPGSVSSVSRVDNLSSSANEVYLSFASKLGILLDCDHVVNQIIVVPSQDEVLRALDRERKKMVSGINSVDNRINGAEIQEFLDAAYSDGKFAVKVHVNIITWGEDSQIRTISSKISAALSSMSITAAYNKFNTPLLYYACIPSNAFEIGSENVMTMELMSALCLSGYETFDRGIPGGSFYVCDRMRNVPLQMDIQSKCRDAGLIGNYNTAILGGSGTGKSFFTNSLLRNLYDRNESIFVIDVGDSYQGLCSLIAEASGGKDGQYLSWDMEHPLSFNPFIGYESWLNENGVLKPDEVGVNFFLSFLQTVWSPAGGWTESTSIILRKTVTDFITALCSRETPEDGALPVLDDYYVFLSDVQHSMLAGEYCNDGIAVSMGRFDIEDFRMALSAYSRNGVFGFLMNDPHPKDLFTSRFIVFEVDALSRVDDKKFYSLCILCIMNAFDMKMRKTFDFKVLVIEEAWKAIANETMAPYLAGLWKTARKFNTAATVVTQEIEDITSSPVIKTAILDNSDVKILLDQSNHLNSFGKIQDAFSLTDKDRNLILTMNRANNPLCGYYREVFFKLGGKASHVFAIEVSPEEALAFESAKDRKEPMLNLARETGSYEMAISKLTEERSKKNLS